jgi:hypothetical protein
VKSGVASRPSLGSAEFIAPGRRRGASHNESAYPPIADMGADIVDGSEVPIGDIPNAPEHWPQSLRTMK